MKYSQFLELDSILEENYVTTKDLKDEQVLNEVSSLLLLGGALASGLGIIFGKRLLRLGVKQFYLLRLNKIAKKYERLIIKKTSSIGEKTAKIRQSFINKEKTLKNIGGEEAETELEALAQRKRNYDRKITRDLDDMITKNSSFKTKEVHSRIDDIKRLKESQKLALKGYWELLIIDIKVDAFNNLIEDGIITDESVIDSLKAELSEEKEDAKDKMTQASNKVRDENKAEEIQGDPVDILTTRIKDLALEKSSLGDEETNRQAKDIIKEIKKLEKEKRDLLYKTMVDEFGRDFIIKLRREIAGRSQERERQTSLRTVNL